MRILVVAMTLCLMFALACGDPPPKQDAVTPGSLYIYPVKGVPAVVLQVRLQATGEEMKFRVPALRLHKSGGASWKDLPAARREIVSVQILLHAERQLTLEPTHSILASPTGWTRVDEFTLECLFEPLSASVAWDDTFHEASYLTVLVIVHPDSDMTTISASLEPGDNNLKGIASGTIGSSGAVAGPARTILRSE